MPWQVLSALPCGLWRLLLELRGLSIKCASPCNPRVRARGRTPIPPPPPCPGAPLAQPTEGKGREGVW